MARNSRLLIKKRKDRQTGSPQTGALVQLALFSLVLVVGIVLLGIVLVRVVLPQWRANQVFEPATCTVLQTRLRQSEGDSGLLYRPEVRIAYQVNGQTHETWTYDIIGEYSPEEQQQKELLSQFRVGDQHRCWYDPADPQTAVLVRYRWYSWFAVLLPLAFIAVGGSGLGYSLLRWGKSTERLVAQPTRTPLNMMFEAKGVGDLLAGLPRDTNLTNSPGTHLRFRLPVGGSSTWHLIMALAVAVVVNLVAVVFLFQAIQSHVVPNQDPDWLQTAFAFVWVAVGIATLLYFVRGFIIATGIGPTIVEIGEHPLYPGETYPLFVQQAGRLKIHSLLVQLVCVERAIYRQGTNTRTSDKRVYQQTLLEEHGIEIRRGVPLESHLQVTLPDRVMHSFKAAHNEIRWELVVRGDAEGWPVFERAFPIVVYPIRIEEASR